MIQKKLYLDSFDNKNIFLDVSSLEITIVNNDKKIKKIKPIGNYLIDQYFWNTQRPKKFRENYLSYLLYKLLLKNNKIEYNKELYVYLENVILNKELSKLVHSLSVLSEYIGNDFYTKELKNIYIALYINQEYDTKLLKKTWRVIDDFFYKEIKSKSYFQKTNNLNKINLKQVLQFGLTGQVSFATGLNFRTLGSLQDLPREEGSFFDRTYLIADTALKVIKKIKYLNTIITKDFIGEDILSNFLENLKNLSDGLFVEFHDLGTGIFSLILEKNGEKLKYRLKTPSDRNILAINILKKENIQTALASIPLCQEDLSNLQEINKSFSLHDFCVEL